MAFAEPDPKRVEADRRRMEQRRLDDIRTIEEQRRIKQEIRSCYHPDEGGYSPAQIRNAGVMIQAQRTCERIAKAEVLSKAGIPVWTRKGRSRGGKHKGNLYVCNIALVDRTKVVA